MQSHCACSKRCAPSASHMNHMSGLPRSRMIFFLHVPQETEPRGRAPRRGARGRAGKHHCPSTRRGVLRGAKLFPTRTMQLWPKGKPSIRNSTSSPGLSEKALPLWPLTSRTGQPIARWPLSSENYVPRIVREETKSDPDTLFKQIIPIQKNRI